MVVQHALAQTAPLTLPEVLQAARSNLDVQLARQAIAGAQGDLQAADRSPFAVLTAKTSSIDLQNGIGDGNLFTQKRIDKSLGVDWTWERGNKRELRTAAAQRALDAAGADLREVQLQQLLAASAAFYDLAAAQERSELVAAIGRSAAQLAATATRRVKAGDLAPQEAARTEIEARRAEGDSLSAQLDQQRAALALAQLTGLAAGNKMAEASALRAMASWPALTATTATSLDASAREIDDALARRSDVQAAELRVQAAQAALDGAAAQKKADITWGTSIDHYPGTSTRLLELRLQMPLQLGALGGYDFQGEVARARANLDQAQTTLDKTRLSALGDMLRMQRERATAAQRALSYEQDILPRARKVAEAAELAYSKGALSLSDLLDARRTLRATLLDALDARNTHAKAMAAWQLRTQPESLGLVLP